MNSSFVPAQPAHETVIILDFGAQYTQLIARRVRENGVYCEILPFDVPARQIAERKPAGLILSGGPSSVYDEGAPHPDPDLFSVVDSPILGICYGFQLIAEKFGASVQPAENREYGYARLNVVDEGSKLFSGLPGELDVWMSHGDHVTAIPESFRLIGLSKQMFSAIENVSSRIYAVQFHPEVSHTPLGSHILRNFVIGICGCKGDWTAKAVIGEQVSKISARAGANDKVICGLSGGVDSAVAAAIVQQAVGGRQKCIFVDTGLLREGEFVSTLSLFRQRMNLDVSGVQAGARFLKELSGVTDPEAKRKIIGRLFIEVFEEEAARIGGARFLVQGTLYPDVIESVSVRGPASVIKSHHNVGGLPETMTLELIEPLRELFKDEVRLIGRELGVPSEIIDRHPFPGPGLAVRILGEVNAERVSVVQAADRIIEEEMRRSGVYGSVWQCFPVLLPVSSVGVMGDGRTYERVIAVRAVTSVDGMTADWARIPHETLALISSRITSEVRGVNRVVYDISSKPPSTIEWE